MVIQLFDGNAYNAYDSSDETDQFLVFSEGTTVNKNYPSLANIIDMDIENIYTVVISSSTFCSVFLNVQIVDIHNDILMCRLLRADIANMYISFRCNKGYVYKNKNIQITGHAFVIVPEITHV